MNWRRTGSSGRIAAVIASRWTRNALISRKYKDEQRGHGVEVSATNVPFDVARPEGKIAERIRLSDEVTIGAKRIVSVRPREDIAPLIALMLVQSGAPDHCHELLTDLFRSACELDFDEVMAKLGVRDATTLVVRPGDEAT